MRTRPSAPPVALVARAPWLLGLRGLRHHDLVGVEVAPAILGLFLAGLRARRRRLRRVDVADQIVELALRDLVWLVRRGEATLLLLVLLGRHVDRRAADRRRVGRDGAELGLDPPAPARVVRLALLPV